MNRHAGTLADVWKHLVLAEVVRSLRPQRYAETHAGHAVNPLAPDAERRYGIRHAAAALTTPCTYLDVVRPFLARDSYPGSAAIALSVAPDADALLCDTDPGSVADLRGWAARQGLAHTQVVTGDGVAAVRPWLAQSPAAPTLVHVDPFDPWAAEPGSTSSLELAADVVAAGHALAYWYGYDRPDDRDWAIEEIGAADLWAGDLLVTTAAGTVEDDGDLGDATTPGTGCGVVLAGVDRGVARRLERLGEALVAAYAGAPLPDGRPGGLDFLVDVA